MITTQVPFADIDPHSQEALSSMFGIDVATLPPTPGVQGPDFPPPEMPRLGG